MRALFLRFYMSIKFGSSSTSAIVAHVRLDGVTGASVSPASSKDIKFAIMFAAPETYSTRGGGADASV